MALAELCSQGASSQVSFSPAVFSDPVTLPFTGNSVHAGRPYLRLLMAKAQRLVCEFLLDRSRYADPNPGDAVSRAEEPNRSQAARSDFANANGWVPVKAGQPRD
jgi:hypothetical protein